MVNCFPKEYQRVIYAIVYVCNKLTPALVAANKLQFALFAFSRASREVPRTCTLKRCIQWAEVIRSLRWVAVRMTIKSCKEIPHNFIHKATFHKFWSTVFCMRTCNYNYKQRNTRSIDIAQFRPTAFAHSSHGKISTKKHSKCHHVGLMCSHMHYLCFEVAFCKSLIEFFHAFYVCINGQISQTLP